MIDMLVLRCDFERVQDSNSYEPRFIWPDFYLGSLSIPLEESKDRDGDVVNVRHPWESIPSSFYGMSFKVFDHRFDPLDSFYIEIKASPAKIMAGHNIYGSSDIYDCSMHLMALLCEFYPQVAERLNHDSWSLSQIDITFSARAKDDHEATQFINSLHQVSFGQTKSRTGFNGTAYFGKKNSRLKKIKVYGKWAEVQEIIKKNLQKVDGVLLNEVYTPEVLAFSRGLVRWECSLYHRYFERLGISTRLKDIFREGTFHPQALQNYWTLATSDLFKSLKGQTMKTLNTLDIKAALRVKYSKTSLKTGLVSTVLADSAFRTYNDIKRDGWVIASESMSISTFRRHILMLCDCGFSRAALQNMTGLDDGAKIIPFVRFITVDFGQQFPDWYEQPAPVHVQPPRLSLVA